jgi:hypothetical protein
VSDLTIKLNRPAQQIADMAPYYGDEYSRESCIMAIDVQRDGYLMQVFAPNGAPMETYAVAKTPRQLGRMVEKWCSGFPPKLNGRLD